VTGTPSPGMLLPLLLLRGGKGFTVRFSVRNQLNPDAREGVAKGNPTENVEDERRGGRRGKRIVPRIMASPTFLRDDIVRTKLIHSLAMIMSQCHTTLTVIVCFVRTLPTPTDFTKRRSETCSKANPWWGWGVVWEVDAIGESDRVVRGEGVGSLAGDGEGKDGVWRGGQDPRSGDCDGRFVITEDNL
jgi:hypothetical protein